MKGYIIKNMQLATGSMLTTHTTTAARTMTTCATNKNTKNRRIKFNMKTKKIETTLSWKPERNMLSRNLVIKALLLLMLTGLATAKGTENSFNTHKMSTMTNKLKEQYSQPLYSTASSENNADDVFRPMIPKDMKSDYISRNMFTKTGQYRVFQPVESDLRRATAIDNSNQRRQLLHHQRMWEAENLQADSSIQHGIDNEISEFTEFGKAAIFDEPTNKAMFVVDKHMLPLALTTERTTTTSETPTLPPTLSTIITTPTPETTLKEILTTELKSLDDLLVEYMENFYNNGAFEPLPELVIELQNNHTATTTISPSGGADENNLMRRVRGIARDSATSPSSLDTVTDKIHFNLPRALQTGRLLFFTGLKKILWPVFVGLQILKSLLLAMFLPSLIGSFGKLVGKGIASASIRPMEAPQELDFRDNSFNFDEENNKFIINDDGGGKDGAAYAYNQPEASQTHYSHTTYDAANINNQALSRYGVNEKQLNKMPDSYMSVLQSLGAASFKNSGSFSSGSSQPVGGGGGAAALVSPAMRPKPMAAANLNNFQTFQKVPASSLLLSNYDPFYSPLLSRLDSVFAQLKLNSANEVCREKLICLMYANPAKYAPYSNLVSAQLSRELNELRKPTSDNPDILRFFKYMRAAKDGQDGIDCEESFDGCKEFKDFENPAMVSTYHDINKLVQARKMN